ncbi:MAG: hypothetical protein LBP32_00100 [Spirochaetaceae bacterium]|jgi:hypothetical protein|nr:hypothetical protein [Spirochaetaceae bacterium]
MPELYIIDHILPILEARNYRTQFFQIFKLFSRRVTEVGPDIVRLVFKRNIDAKARNLAPKNITMRQVYLDLITKAQEAGEIGTRMNPESLLEVIIHMVNGIGVAWCNQNCDFDYEEECLRLIDLVFH